MRSIGGAWRRRRPTRLHGQVGDQVGRLQRGQPGLQDVQRRDLRWVLQLAEGVPSSARVLGADRHLGQAGPGWALAQLQPAPMLEAGTVMCPAVALTAARHRPLAMAAVPMANRSSDIEHGPGSCPGSLTGRRRRPASLEHHRRRVVAAQPQAVEPAAIFTPAAVGRTR
jgi:hypothetical protein